MFETPEGLLVACEDAAREGTDFPTVWMTILNPHGLVIGLPTHRILDGEAQIVVRLATGQTLISGRNGYALV